MACSEQIVSPSSVCNIENSVVGEELFRRIDGAVETFWRQTAVVKCSGAGADKCYDYLLKILLVGDSDVGKHEILSLLSAEQREPAFITNASPGCRTTVILLDGKRVKLQMWDTSGQGRFSTILRSYSRGVQGVLLVYDITNKWSFDSLARWLKEVDEHAPGIPKILVGNRCHLAHRRRVSLADAENLAAQHEMAFFELSPLCNYNVRESFTELSRLALHRNGMDRVWRTSRVLSLQELCCRRIVSCSTVYTIEQLPLPAQLRNYLKSYAMCGFRTHSQQPTAAGARANMARGTSTQRAFKHRHKIITPDTYRQPRTHARGCVIL